MPGCDARIADDALLAYWVGESESAGASDEALEAHLFTCADCSARLEWLAAIATGVTALARQGRVQGLISRALVNRLQRDGIRVRQYSVSPGEAVPCAVFPGDDLVVTSLRADFSGTSRVSLSAVGDHSPFGGVEEFDVSPADTEVLWAFPAAPTRQLPSVRLAIILTALEPDRRVLGEYVLDHTAFEQPSGS